MERDERRGDDRPGARHGWRTPGDASERAERPVQERASLLHDRSMRAWSCLVAVAALVVGCSTGPGPIAPTDAGIASPVPPLAPARVEPTCPDGWLPSALSLGGAACVPWVEAPRCGDGQLLVAGRGCVPLATHCDDEFAADAPPDAVYVRPTGAGGDGTRAHPYATIAEALRTGAHVVALSAGEHRSADLQLEGVTLLGACSDTTTLRLQATLIAHTGTTRIARLRVRGAQPRPLLEQHVRPRWRDARARGGRARERHQPRGPDRRGRLARGEPRRGPRPERALPRRDRPGAHHARPRGRRARDGRSVRDRPDVALRLRHTHRDRRRRHRDRARRRSRRPRPRRVDGGWARAGRADARGGRWELAARRAPAWRPARADRRHRA